MTSHRVHTLKLSDIRGWSMLCEEPGKVGEGGGGWVENGRVEPILKDHPIGHLSFKAGDLW